MSKSTRRREMARAREAARAALADDGRSRAVAALVRADGTEPAR